MLSLDHSFIHWRMLVFIACTCLCLHTSLWAQPAAFSVPVTFYVENAAFLGPVSDVAIKVEQRVFLAAGNSYVEQYGTNTTDSTGNVVVSLLPNQSYLLTITREGFFSQLMQLNTANFSRTGRNGARVSLRPKKILTFRGNVLVKKNIKLQGTATLINTATKAQRTKQIDSTGRYKIQGIAGEPYELKLVVPPYLDTLVRVDDLEQTIVMGEPSFVVDFPLEAATKELVPEEVYETGDSLVLQQLQFEGKTADLRQAKWLDTLSRALLNQPALKVRLEIHTDTRKSHRFNRLLAEKRAEKLKRALLAKQVPEERFACDPLGEEFPINDCRENRKCSAAMHQENDRVVLIVESGELSLKSLVY